MAEYRATKGFSSQTETLLVGYPTDAATGKCAKLFKLKGFTNGNDLDSNQ